MCQKTLTAFVPFRDYVKIVQWSLMILFLRSTLSTTSHEMLREILLQTISESNVKRYSAPLFPACFLMSALHMHFTELHNWRRLVKLLDIWKRKQRSMFVEIYKLGRRRSMHYYYHSSPQLNTVRRSCVTHARASEADLQLERVATLLSFIAIKWHIPLSRTSIR